MTSFAATARGDDYQTPSGSAQMARALITGIDLGFADGPVAEVKLSTGQTDRILLSQTVGRSGVARVGESWIVSRPYGRWIFTYLLRDAVPVWQPLDLLGTAAQVNTTGAPWTSGSSTRLQAAWLLDEQYEVHLRGAITGVAASTSNATGPIAADFARLPDQARPPGLMRFLCHDSGAATPAVVTAYPDGLLRLTAASGTGAAVGLDQVRWLVDPAT